MGWMALPHHHAVQSGDISIVDIFNVMSMQCIFKKKIVKKNKVEFTEKKNVKGIIFWQFNFLPSFPFSISPTHVLVLIKNMGPLSASIRYRANKKVLESLKVFSSAQLVFFLLGHGATQLGLRHVDNKGENWNWPKFGL